MKIVEARIKSLALITKCLESNSKGSEDSPERAAVNNRNQSLGADMTKEADLQCYYEFRNTDVNCILAVHDALVFEVPGTATVNWEKSKKEDDVWTHLEFDVSQDAKDVAERIVKIMEDVQTQFYKDMGSNIKGKAEAGLGMFWGH